MEENASVGKTFEGPNEVLQERQEMVNSGIYNGVVIEEWTQYEEQLFSWVEEYAIRGGKGEQRNPRASNVRFNNRLGGPMPAECQLCYKTMEFDERSQWRSENSWPYPSNEKNEDTEGWKVV